MILQEMRNFYFSSDFDGVKKLKNLVQCYLLHVQFHPSQMPNPLIILKPFDLSWFFPPIKSDFTRLQLVPYMYMHRSCMFWYTLTYHKMLQIIDGNTIQMQKTQELPWRGSPPGPLQDSALDLLWTFSSPQTPCQILSPNIKSLIHPCL